jgi:hypothetical protein
VTGQNFTEITWTFLGAIYKVEIDQRWIVLKEVVQKLKKTGIKFFYRMSSLYVSGIFVTGRTFYSCHD